MGLPELKIKKYFGSASIEEMVFSLDEARSHLDYFWTQDGSSNIIMSIDGHPIKSYDDLVALVNSDRYKDKALIEIGLFLSNDGKKSIWPR